MRLYSNMKNLTLPLFLACASFGAAQDFDAWITAHANFVVGDQNDLDLPGHAHDAADGQYVQGSDIAFNFEAMGWLSGFAGVAIFQNEEQELAAEMEEAFLRADIPDTNLSVRAGQFLNRIGTQNNVHLHSWDFVDSNLSTAHFLGEEGLGTQGVELNWLSEFDQGLFALSVGYGSVVAHDHAHDEHDDEEEEDDDDLEEEEEHEEGLEGEALTARALVKYNVTDFQQYQLGLNYMTAFDVDHDLYGVDFYYTWSAAGLEGGGDSFTIGGEYYNLNNGEEDFGSVLLAAHYRFANGCALHARYEWLEFGEHHEEEDGTEVEEEFARQRYSIGASYTQQISEDWSGRVLVQYNYDRISGEDGKDSADEVWLQLGLSYGSKEEIR